VIAAQSDMENKTTPAEIPILKTARFKQLIQTCFRN